MQSSQPRRRHSGSRLVFLAGAVALSLLVFFLTNIGTSTGEAATSRIIVPPRRLVSNLRAMMESPVEVEESVAVLLPEWEVLVLLVSSSTADDHGDARCEFFFQGGAGGGGSSWSPARRLGRIPEAASSGRGGSGITIAAAYSCMMPRAARRRQPFRAPRLLINTNDTSSSSSGSSTRTTPMMLRWSHRLVYHAVALHDGDVLVFAKGVMNNNRNGTQLVRCIYYHPGYQGEGRNIIASLVASTSAQQVFRCPPPPPTPAPATTTSAVAVSLAILEGDHDKESPIIILPSMARLPMELELHERDNKKKKVMMCACTMVRDVAKFLREWVLYHAAVGVDRFFLLDNGSQDDLEGQVGELKAAGYDVSTEAWPWPKTQEAGFSYAAAAHRDSCEWMAFIDVDEFIVSPSWAKSREPSKSMLRRALQLVLPTNDPRNDDDVGQVMLGCMDFGPSGRTRHPEEEGVTQGYTCRTGRPSERHKSLVRLDAVDPTLLNSIHHFQLRPGFRSRRRSKTVRVNHYKYQAWDEFKLKFRRRVSTYVPDWTDPVNPGSKDRTPGLGFHAVEPPGWPNKFCDLNDTLLRNLTRTWFGLGFNNRPIAPTHHIHTSSLAY